MSNTTMSAEPRDRAGKGAARATRRAGRVPAVIYGDKKDPELISLDPIELMKQLRSATFFSSLCDLKVGSDNHRVLPKDIQYHPVTDDPMHVDFMRVSKGATVTVTVPVEFTNEDACPGIKRGGVLNVVRHEVDLICPVDSIPELLTIDLSTFEIGDGARISDAGLPEGVTPTITDRDFMLASIAAPTAVKDEAAAAAAEAAAEAEAEADAEGGDEG